MLRISKIKDSIFLVLVPVIGFKSPSCLGEDHLKTFRLTTSSTSFAGFVWKHRSGRFAPFCSCGLEISGVENTALD
jgi:hypothetical protein